MVAMLLTGFSSFLPQATAIDDCALLGGAIVGSECQINSVVSASSTYNLVETLHLLSGGQIIVPPIGGGNTLTLNITGDFVMDIGSKISGDAVGSSAKAATININASGNIALQGDGVSGAEITANQSAGSCTGGAAGNINIQGTGAGGTIITDAGTLISANGAPCPAGAIVIQKTNKGAITINGRVLSDSTLSGTGANQRPGGGPITIIAACDLTVGPTALIKSSGKDPGADRVHLQAGCETIINGIVASSGIGHGVPDNPVNLCAHAARPDKSTSSTACVEIWAGNSLVIDHTGNNIGEVFADTGGPGGSSGTSWVDVFARGTISILGGNNLSFAVHANGLAASNDTGGIVTVKSRDNTVTVSGRAIQASATGNGGRGGTVIIDSNLNTNVSGATLEAAGATSGGAPHGGAVAIRSRNGDITTDANSIIDVTGKSTPDGTINLTACGSIGFPAGTTAPIAVTPSKIIGACGGTPTFQSYVVFLNCPCADTPPETPVCLDTICSGVTVSVEQNVTIDFNSATPVCNGDADLCALFSWDKSGATPANWNAIFNLGASKLLVKNGATITTAPVGSGNSKYAPGIVINTTCSIEIEAGAAIVVRSLNQQAGDIYIQGSGISVNGLLLNEVVGTKGLPGKITLESTCGDYTQGATGLVEVLGIDPGGNEINILTHEKSNIVINGLVLSRAHAHIPPLTANRPNINVAAFDGKITITANTAEPLYDEYSYRGAKYDLWGGLLSWVTDNVNPGTVRVQASGDILVNGHGDDPTAPVRQSFGAIAAIATASNAPGGVVDVRSLGGNISGNDHAFDVSGRNRLATNFALNRVWAAKDINLARLGTNSSFNPIVDASSPTSGDKGGKNEIRAWSGAIANVTNSLISAKVPAGGGSVQGINLLTSCMGIMNSAIAFVDPLDLVNGDDIGTCAPASPPQLLFP